MNQEFETVSAAMVAGIESKGGVAGIIDGLPIPFFGPDHERTYREQDVRLEERRKERARIARELHDTLFQGFLGASLLLHTAVEQTPSNLPSKPLLTHALDVIYRVIDEGRVALQGLRSSPVRGAGLEEVLCALREELTFDGNVQFRVFVTGRPTPLNPELQEQIYFIAREAVANALRHSGAKTIEAEVQYMGRGLRVVVRDNGCGMDEGLLRSGRNSHWGLLGMRERAESIGAQLRVWSGPGAGTEVETTTSLENETASN
jgi:signal transduction histidine kinase